MTAHRSKTPIAVGIVGPGLIGSTLIKQLAAQSRSLQNDLFIDLHIVAIVSTRAMYLYNQKGCDMETWQTDLAMGGEPPDLDKFTDFFKGFSKCHKIIIDCTANATVPSYYVRWLSTGIHVITPNKKLCSGPMDEWTKVRDTYREHATHFMYEATVGAGLPVISTLNSLLETGDQMLHVEGILSGTLSFIFNSFGAGKTFSQVVADAKAKGYTEPDPREDLAGTDVARKMIILGRECGLAIDMQQVTVQSLVPPQLTDTQSADDFMTQLPQYDSTMQGQAQAAAAQGMALRYVGSLDFVKRECTVELKQVPLAHPFANLNGSDNIISIKTKRYNEQPLVIRGPGAGAEVTAAGVFGDLLHVVKMLGMP